MGEIIQFRPLMRYGKRPDAQARLERELQIPFTAMPKLEASRPRANVQKISLPNATSRPNFPLSGIAIVVGSILVYALVISHVVGQPHYSARANLMPQVFVQY
ncbi:hypothetical protein ACQZ6F_01160 [Rhizobium sp. A22-96]